MKNPLLILFAMLVLAACNSPSRLAPTPSPLAAHSSMMTETFPPPTAATYIPPAP